MFMQISNYFGLKMQMQQEQLNFARVCKGNVIYDKV